MLSSLEKMRTAKFYLLANVGFLMISKPMYSALISDLAFHFPLSLHGQHLIAFESPIDLLSQATLQQCGYLADVDFADAHRLSLGGTSDVALVAYLERKPFIKQVILCLDNDEAGRTAPERIRKKLAADSRFEHIGVENRSPQNGTKDYN